MARHIVSGIDIGSANIRVAVCERGGKDTPVRVLALIQKPSRGIRKGHIVSAEDLGESLGSAIEEARRVSGVKIKNAIVAINGIGLSTHKDSGSIAISKVDQEVTDLDIERAIKESERSTKEKNNIQIIHSIPYLFKLDGKRLLGRPEGLHATKLEVQNLFITVALAHLNELIRAIESCGVVVDDVFAGSMSESFVALKKKDKNAGCCIANIGSETVSIATFEEGLPTSLKVFPIGSSDITKDIALCLKIPLEEAEAIKLGQQRPDKRYEVKIKAIIDARLKDFFDAIDGHLKKIGRSGLLPAGVVLTGGGSEMAGVAELARRHLGLPTRLAGNGESLRSTVRGHGQGQGKTTKLGETARSASWALTYGLCLLGLDSDKEDSLGLRVVKRTKGTLFNFIRQLLP